MSETRTETASVVARTRPVAAGAPIVAVHFMADTAVFVLGEEALLLVAPAGEPRRIEVHGGAILSAAADGRRVVTGGDDGKVMATAQNGETTQVATDAKCRWIDHVALGSDGAVAWSAGKEAHVRTRSGEERVVEAPSTVGGLAFAPKGFRLAFSHYNGASLWFPNAAAAPERLEWKGSHLDVTFSPDGKFLVTAMQEPTLHGWRIVDARHMRMSGYTAKVRSMDWTAGGKWLATSGSSQLILWPFQGKDGPMGKQPRLLAPSVSRVITVACHPKQEVVAVGYEDGLVLLVRVEDGAEIVAKHPGNAPVSALAWDKAGNQLAFGTEDGEAGVVGL
ncbi:MAG TPA: WD40 repeat domain-containing protein [Xanthobacteraceae bacterium]|nr:WD40 repeat domain-containing protein [Xanthobacteraceae bacterium]